MEKRIYIIAPEEEGLRLDKLATLKLGGFSRSQVQQLIEAGQILLEGKPAKAKTKVRRGVLLEMVIPPPKSKEVLPENISLDIVYEDQDLLLVNKPQGLVVHPAPGTPRGTLVNALLYHCPNLSQVNGKKRPGIVHRLDKDTSGIMVVAKNDFAHQKLTEQLKEKKVVRNYLAIVHGNVLEAGGRIDGPIGRHPIDRKRMTVIDRNSKAALTEYVVKERFGNYTLLEANLHTGRTHQIRVHLAYIKHPVLGDPVYGPKQNPFGLTAQVLHAYKLGFQHPSSDRYVEFTAPLPDYFTKLLKKIG